MTSLPLSKCVIARPAPIALFLKWSPLVVKSPQTQYLSLTPDREPRSSLLAGEITPCIDGRGEQSEKRDEVFFKPRSRKVAEFLEARNLYRAKVLMVPFPPWRARTKNLFSTSSWTASLTASSQPIKKAVSPS